MAATCALALADAAKVGRGEGVDAPHIQQELLTSILRIPERSSLAHYESAVDVAMVGEAVQESGLLNRHRPQDRPHAYWVSLPDDYLVPIRNIIKP
jgi:hypothetical protein